MTAPAIAPPAPNVYDFPPKPEMDQFHAEEYSAGYELTDLGNADRFYRDCNEMVRYSVEQNNWMIWDGTRWVLDRQEKIYDLAGKAVRSIFNEARNAVVKEEAARLSKWALRSQDKVQIEHMLALAKNKVAVLINQFDRDPWLLNCQNGTVELRTGLLMTHDPGDLITKTVNARYIPDAKCPTWTAFLGRIMGGNVETIRFLQRAIGYSITGQTIEQIMFILYGGGANGKSTFLETLARLLGDGYATGTPTESIMQKRFDGGIPNDLARLKGARLVNINEVERGRRMAESKIKAMTGGDTVTARFMRGEFFDFIPEFKLWLRANHKPVITGTDNAIWRRIRLIPFEVEIPKDEQDPYLMDKLSQEYEGILAWAVAGCLDWQRERLNPPEKVVNATSKYRNEMDTIGNFLDEKTEAGESVLSKILYQAYTSWCEDSGDRPLTQRAFSQTLTEKGFENKHTMRGNVFMGISIAEKHEG
jgi:putative DNA primase/helicase